MKKILITGANSYIGVSFENYLKNNFSGDYEIDTVDMQDAAWREISFSGYDAVFHVAGIAHVKETAQNCELYYKVNRDLAADVAVKAKEDGVSQFVFLSSMSVYGLETGVITADTVPMPKTNYGKSKLQAEEKIFPLADGGFKVAVLRPPMVYGEGCKGNYQALVKIAEKFSFFADYSNKRSVIHIQRLCEFVKSIIDECKSGLFFPQDEKYACTCKMILNIAECKGRKIRLLKILNPAISLLKLLTTKGKKAFGDLIYMMDSEQNNLLG